MCGLCVCAYVGQANELCDRVWTMCVCICGQANELCNRVWTVCVHMWGRLISYVISEWTMCMCCVVTRTSSLLVDFPPPPPPPLQCYITHTHTLSFIYTPRMHSFHTHIFFFFLILARPHGNHHNSSSSSRAYLKSSFTQVSAIVAPPTSGVYDLWDVLSLHR